MQLFPLPLHLLLPLPLLLLLLKHLLLVSGPVSSNGIIAKGKTKKINEIPRQKKTKKKTKRNNFFLRCVKLNNTNTTVLVHFLLF